MEFEVIPIILYDSPNQDHRQDIDKERVKKEKEKSEKRKRMLYVMSLY
jgi:hypothetical protein